MNIAFPIFGLLLVVLFTISGKLNNPDTFLIKASIELKLTDNFHEDAGIADKRNVDITIDITKRKGLCPPPSTLKGNCTIDPIHNCLSDDKCLEPNHKCCREGKMTLCWKTRKFLLVFKINSSLSGCNKICKPIVPLPTDFEHFQDFGIFNKWKTQKMKEWNTWADQTKKTLMYVRMIKCCSKLMSTAKCIQVLNQFLQSQMEIYQAQISAQQPHYS